MVSKFRSQHEKHLSDAERTAVNWWYKYCYFIFLKIFFNKKIAAQQPPFDTKDRMIINFLHLDNIFSILISWETIKFPNLRVAREKMGLLLGFCILNNWKEFLYESNYSGWWCTLINFQISYRFTTGRGFGLFSLRNRYTHNYLFMVMDTQFISYSWLL